VSAQIATPNVPSRTFELETLEQLNVTPITRGQFIIAKLLPFWTLGLIELSLGLLIGKLVFDVPMHGSLPLLYAVAGVYLAVAVGIGLWVSTLVDTQQQAMFVTFFIVNIYLLMSGRCSRSAWTPHGCVQPWRRFQLRARRRDVSAGRRPRLHDAHRGCEARQ
jgi:ABC-2 type transport system permease protein